MSEFRKGDRALLEVQVERVEPDPDGEVVVRVLRGNHTQTRTFVAPAALHPWTEAVPKRQVCEAGEDWPA